MKIFLCCLCVECISLCVLLLGLRVWYARANINCWNILQALPLFDVRSLSTSFYTVSQIFFLYQELFQVVLGQLHRGCNLATEGRFCSLSVGWNGLVHSPLLTSLPKQLIDSLVVRTDALAQNTVFASPASQSTAGQWRRHYVNCHLSVQPRSYAAIEQSGLV